MHKQEQIGEEDLQIVTRNHHATHERSRTAFRTVFS